MGDVLIGIGAAEFENRLGARADRNAWLFDWTSLWAQRTSAWLFYSDDLMGYSPYGVVCARHRDFAAGHFGHSGPSTAFGSGGSCNSVQRASCLHSADASASSCYHCGPGTSCGLGHNPVLRRWTERSLHECLARTQETRPRGGKSSGVSVGNAHK